MVEVQAVVVVPPTTLNQLLVKQPSLPMDLPMDQPVLVMGTTDTLAVAAVEPTVEKMEEQPLLTLVVQAMTILFSVLYFAYDTKFDSVFVFYFMVGSNQVISCLANLFLDKRLRNSTRSYYQFLLLLLIAFFFLSVLNNVFGVIQTDSEPFDII